MTGGILTGDCALIPTYNERENVKYLLPTLRDRYPDLNILVIDDNSPDGTQIEIRKLMERDDRIYLLPREKKEGLGVAYRSGIAHVFSLGEPRYVLFMDADGSHDPEYVGVLIEALKENDLAIGSRYVAGGSIENWEEWRYALSRYGNLYAQTITRLPISDLTAGFMGIRGELLKRMAISSLRSSGYAYQMEFKCEAIDRGARVREVPIIFKSRREGESKISKHIIAEGLITPWRILGRRMASFL